MIIFSIVSHLIQRTNLCSLSTNRLQNKKKAAHNYVTVMGTLFAENGELSVLHIANSLTQKYHYF